MSPHPRHDEPGRANVTRAVGPGDSQHRAATKDPGPALGLVTALVTEAGTRPDHPIYLGDSYALRWRGEFA
jgi:hypothetical protein